MSHFIPGVIVALVFSAVLCSKLIKTIPRDLIFTTAALLAAFAGILTSQQIFQAATSQAMQATLGFWLMGKALQHQGILHVLSRSLPSSRYSLCIAPVCGALLSPWYFPLRQSDGRFNYLCALGSMASIIGTPTNLLFVSLCSPKVPGLLSNLFVFAPLAIVPVLLSLFFFLLFSRISWKTLVDRQDPESPILWKQIAVCFLWVTTLVATLLGWPVGSAFLCAGLLALMLRTVPVSVLRERLPLPSLLEIFSAALFFFAMDSSGLNVSLAHFMSMTSPSLILPVLFMLALLASRGMPRPVAFAILFSPVSSLFAGSPAQILVAGAVIAFATALPLFGKFSSMERVEFCVERPLPVAVRLSAGPVFFAGTMIAGLWLL